MKRRFLIAVGLVSLCVATLVVSVNSGLAQLAPRSEFGLPGQAVPLNPTQLQGPEQILSTACALQPAWQRSKRSQQEALNRSVRLAPDAVSLERFRQPQAASALTAEEKSSASPLKSMNSYTPSEEIALIDPTNFGDRFLRDLDGKPALLDPIVVLHETVGSASNTITFFRTPHPDDADQASYHTLLKRDGTVVYLVPPDKRAFGAGNSIFNGPNGPESVKTNPDLPGSVNNFAYHVSLETPYDGNNNAYRHSGYTEAQYQSLAWLVAKTGVPEARITTHKAVDRSHSRLDPRSFDESKFLTLLNTYPRTTEISTRCTDPTQASPSSTVY